MRKFLIAAVAAVALVAAFLVVPALGSSGTVYACVSGSNTLTHVSVTRQLSCPSQRPVNWPAQVGPAPSPSPSPSLSPTGSPSPSPSPTGNTCTVTNAVCGPFSNGNIPMANGYNTYVEAQQVGPQSGTSDTITATDPGNWTDVAHDVPYGYGGVQMFDNVQQLTNDWNSNGTWGGAGALDTPVDALSALKVNYSETSPRDANSIYEFAPDVWQDNYNTDVMFWADTSPARCTGNGLDSSQLIGHVVLEGQNWTVYRYGGQPGDEIIFILDGTSSTDPVTTGTCAQQTSGTIDIKAGLDWLVANGFETGPPVISQLNTGWEITSADNTTFTMNSYSITATVK